MTNVKASYDHYEGNDSTQHSTNPQFDFAKIGIQPKLKVSQPGDLYEQEADRVAEEVMRVPFQGSAIPLTTPKDKGIGRKCGVCEMEEEDGKTEKQELVISRKSSSTASNFETTEETANDISNVLSSSGSPLDPSTRQYMETRFGHDFNNVRVHTDTRAAESAQAVNAYAYTVGHNIVFGACHFQPETYEGKRLIAHELTHVIQQHSSMNENIVGQKNEKYDLSPVFPAVVGNRRKHHGRPKMASIGVQTNELTLQRAVCPGGHWRRADDDETAIGAIKQIQIATKFLWDIHQDPNVDINLKRKMIQEITEASNSVLAYMKAIEGQCVGANPMIATTTTWGGGSMNPASVVIAFFAVMLAGEALRRISVPEQRALDDLSKKMAAMAVATAAAEKAIEETAKPLPRSEPEHETPVGRTVDIIPLPEPEKQTPDEEERKRRVNVYAFGFSPMTENRPRGPRRGGDIDVDVHDYVGPEYLPFPRGASSFADINRAPLTGHYYGVPIIAVHARRSEGLDIVEDGAPFGPRAPTHHTIYPTIKMLFQVFFDLFQSLPWRYAGNKRRL